MAIPNLKLPGPDTVHHIQVYTSLPEGSWSFSIMATDSAGNVQTAVPASVSWTVALTAPYAALTSAGSSGAAVSTSGAVSFSFLSLVPQVCHRGLLVWNFSTRCSIVSMQLSCSCQRQGANSRPTVLHLPEE